MTESPGSRRCWASRTGLIGLLATGRSRCVASVDGEYSGVYRQPSTREGQDMATAAAQPVVAPRATGTVWTPRSSLSVILLSIVTLGIYGLYWQYKTFQEMQDHTGNGIGGVLGLVLAIFVGVVNPFIMSAEVGNMYAAEGNEKPVRGVTGFWIPP